MTHAAHFVLALLVALAPLAAQPAAPSLVDEVAGYVEQHFYDRPKYHGCDWKAVRERYRGLEAACAGAPERFALVNRMLGELKASHCALILAEVYRDHLAPEFGDTKTLRCGFELARREQRHYIDRVYDGSAALAAGLRQGDEVVAIDGKPVVGHPDVLDAGNDPGLPGPPHFVVRVRDGAPLALSVVQKPDGAPVVVRFQPNPISLVEATRASVRVIDRQGWSIGHVHLWHFMSPRIDKILADALAGPLAGCDGYVVDLRGRGGRADVMQRSFDRLKDLTRRRPVVCLADEGSRSAKDVFAFNWKFEALGPLVGRRTAGAVIGARFFTLKDGTVLMLPVLNVTELTRGVVLEGKGVDPDVLVPGDGRYAGGTDAILERGLEVVFGRLRRTY